MNTTARVTSDQQSYEPEEGRLMYAAPQIRPMLAGALAAAARGWHVFPLLPNTKRPARPDHRAADCTGTDPRCRNGHTGWDARATTDETRIRRAWAEDQPSYGLGIACGPSGLVVVDLDTAKPDAEIPEPWNRFGITTGAEVLDHIAGARGGTITPTFTVRTPSGGTHLYYQAPQGARFSNTAGTIGWLIDTRAHGGYVVAPPTILATSTSASCYAIVEDRPPAPLPMFLADLLHTRTYTGTASATTPLHGRTSSLPGPSSRPASAGPVRAPKAYIDKVFDVAIHGDAKHGVTGLLEAPEGRRNVALFCAAATVGKLVARGLVTETSATDALLAAAAGHIAAGAYTSYEAEATIRSGFHRAASRRSAA